MVLTDFPATLHLATNHPGLRSQVSGASRTVPQGTELHAHHSLAKLFRPWTHWELVVGKHYRLAHISLALPFIAVKSTGKKQQNMIIDPDFNLPSINFLVPSVSNMRNCWLWYFNIHLLPMKTWCFVGFYWDCRWTVCPVQTEGVCIAFPLLTNCTTAQHAWRCETCTVRPFSVVIYLFWMTYAVQRNCTKGVNDPQCGFKKYCKHTWCEFFQWGQDVRYYEPLLRYYCILTLAWGRPTTGRWDRNITRKHKGLLQFQNAQI